MCLKARGGDGNFIFPRGEIYPESSSLVGGVKVLRAFYTDGSLIYKGLVFVQHNTFYTSPCLENIISCSSYVIPNSYGTGAFVSAFFNLNDYDMLFSFNSKQLRWIA